ncbi:MAG: DUF2442 domain-containing protein [Chloroflexota bacterium]|nr:DUF2442 domain-containing protein [Chloroflexota bacterium]
MHPRVKAVKPNVDYTITLTFTNDEVRVFDVKPYLDKGIFRELKEPSIFNSVRPFLGSIQWQNGQDFCPDTLYLDSVSLEQGSASLASDRLDTSAINRPNP